MPTFYSVVSWLLEIWHVYFFSQFDSLLDVCSSLVVIWRFCGLAGKQYSWERERRYYPNNINSTWFCSRKKANPNQLMANCETLELMKTQWNHRAQRSCLWPWLLIVVKFYSWYHASPLFLYCKIKQTNIDQLIALVVQKLDSAIHRINGYPTDMYWIN